MKFLITLDSYDCSNTTQINVKILLSEKKKQYLITMWNYFCLFSLIFCISLTVLEIHSAVDLCFSNLFGSIPRPFNNFNCFCFGVSLLLSLDCLPDIVWNRTKTKIICLTPHLFKCYAVAWPMHNIFLIQNHLLSRDVSLFQHVWIT